MKHQERAGRGRCPARFSCLFWNILLKLSWAQFAILNCAQVIYILHKDQYGYWHCAGCRLIRSVRRGIRQRIAGR